MSLPLSSSLFIIALLSNLSYVIVFKSKFSLRNCIEYEFRARHVRAPVARMNQVNKLSHGNPFATRCRNLNMLKLNVNRSHIFLQVFSFLEIKFTTFCMQNYSQCFNQT